MEDAPPSDSETVVSNFEAGIESVPNKIAEQRTDCNVRNRARVPPAYEKLIQYQGKLYDSSELSEQARSRVLT